MATVLLDFWGTWCGPCVAALPGLKTAYQRFHGRGFEIIGIDHEKGGTTDESRRFLKARKITWPNATPDTALDLVENRFRVGSFPTLILLDRAGVVIEIGNYELEGGRLIHNLEQLLGTPKIAR